MGHVILILCFHFLSDSNLRFLLFFTNAAGIFVGLIVILQHALSLHTGLFAHTGWMVQGTIFFKLKYNCYTILYWFQRLPKL